MRKFTLIIILLVLVAGLFACAPTQGGSPQADDTPALLTLPPPDGTATPVTGHNSVSNAATPTPASDGVAEADTPPPAPTATTAATPSPTPTATAVPETSPTPTAARVSTSPEDEAGIDDFIENFVSISYEASFDMPSEFAEGGYPVAAAVNGWATMGTKDDPTSQWFMKIEMTKPVTRSIEVVSLPNTFNMYLHDLDANKWYFLPENSSEVDVGPVEDISHLWSYAMLFSLLPPDDAQQTPDGYIRKIEGPASGTVAVTYDQEYTLETLTITDPDGKQFLRARYFDLNKIHDLVPYEPVEELLPDTYWQSQ